MSNLVEKVNNYRKNCVDFESEIDLANFVEKQAAFLLSMKLDKSTILNNIWQSTSLNVNELKELIPCIVLFNNTNISKLLYE